MKNNNKRELQTVMNRGQAPPRATRTPRTAEPTEVGQKSLVPGNLGPPRLGPLTRTASSYERGPSPPARLGPHAPQSPRKLAPKDEGLGVKVRTQANVWAVVFAVMGSALEVQKAECVPIWIYLISHAHIDQSWPPSRYDLRIRPTSYRPNFVKIRVAVQEIWTSYPFSTP